MEDRPEVIAPRRRLYDLIESTPWLDWQLLSKRPENYVRFLPSDWLLHPRRNVWLGTTAEDQDWANKRIRHLLKTPAHLRFLSLEPLLASIDLTSVQVDGRGEPFAPFLEGNVLEPWSGRLAHICWVIVGGESGPSARPMHPDWVRSIRDQCVAAGVPFFFKQHGEWRPLQDSDRSTTFRLLDVGRYIWRDGFTAGWTGPFNGRRLDDGDATLMLRVGRNAAGHLLDGAEWQQVPIISRKLPLQSDQISV
jgi:hypothetical protein